MQNMPLKDILKVSPQPNLVCKIMRKLAFENFFLGDVDTKNKTLEEILDKQLTVKFTV